MDIVDKHSRARMMSAIRGRDTKPELAVRHYLHAAGLRFRLHAKDLPGRPDICFPGRRLAVFVHGCFWHRHAGCKRATVPATRHDFWAAKFEANLMRDQQVTERLTAMGWSTMFIWECETTDTLQLDALTWKLMAHPMHGR